MKDLNLSKQEREELILSLEDYKGGLSVVNERNDVPGLNKKVIKARMSFCDKLLKKIHNSLKTIKVSSAKGKGRSLQYWVCERIASLFNVKFDQKDDSCPIHSREMGLSGVDVVLRGDIAKKFPYAIECKACETLSIPQWIKQAKANTKEGQEYLLVVKKQSIGEPLVVMDWTSFEKLVKKNGL